MMRTEKQTPMEQLPEVYQEILGFLRKGLENARTGEQLMKLAQIKDLRLFSLIIAELIERHGYCIGTSRSGEYRGYYFITCEEELMLTTGTLDNQARSMDRRVQSLYSNFSPDDE